MEQQPSYESIIWEWHDKPSWVAYDLATAQILEKAYSTQQDSKLILDHGVFSCGPYYVDFGNMTQTNQRTSFERNIRRFGGAATSSDAVWTCRIKKKWEPYDPQTCFAIEKAFCSGQKKLSLSRERSYMIDLVEMKQLNLATGFEREIRRQVDEKVRVDAVPPEIKKSRALPRISGITQIAPEKCCPCYGTIIIQVIEGQNLASATIAGSDPFLMITTDFSAFAWKSHWKFKTTNPVWNETCAIHVSRTNMEGKVIFTLYDFNIVTKPVYLGRMEMTLYEIVQLNTINGWRELNYESKFKAGTQKGKLNLQVSWHKNPQPPEPTKINFLSIVENESVIYHKTLAQKATTLISRSEQQEEQQLLLAKRPSRDVLLDVVEFADPNVVEGLSAHYQMTDQIGEGGYAVVRKAYNTTTRQSVAVKIMKTDVTSEDALAKITREIQILQVVNFKYCVCALDSRITKEAIYVVMEYVSGGDLLDAVIKYGSFPETQAKKIIKDVFLGLEYLHQTGICHRDLKPENILLDKEADIWKIADFGCSTWCQPDPFMSGFEGTIQYMAPELFTMDKYTKSIDLWAMGVMTYVVLSGYFPWQGQTNAEIEESIGNNNIVFYSPEFDAITDAAKDFIRQLCESDPTKRMSIENGRKHDWISKR